MKTITKTIIQWRGIRNWAIAAVLFPVLIVAGTARAVSVTNVIYYDTFNRTGQLVGTAPDTVNVPGAVWAGGYPTNGFVTDGTEASITNPLPIVPPYANAFLPLNFETGHVYVVTCTIVGNTNASGLLAFGYSDTPGLFTGPANNVNWGLDWVGVNSSNNGCSYWEYGGIRSFQTNYAFTPSMTYSTVLAVTNTPTGGATNLVGSFFINGTFITTLPAVPATRNTGSGGACVGYVFLGHSTALAAGSFQNFSVTDIVLNATTPTILEQPNNLTAQVGHTATFWVRGYALPDPTYQWMTNGTAIPGATNASYTTPALSTAYNGMQYSVQLSTAAGSVTSSSGTLTVTAGIPTVYSATKTASPNNVVVNFSSPIDPSTGLNPANYAFLVNGAPAGVSVTGVSYGSSSNTVILQTSALNPNTGYYLAVQNVRDQFGEVMNTSTNPVLPSGLVFYFRGDSGVQLDANGNVAQWLDQTTNGNNASQFFGMYPNISSAFISSTTARPAKGTIGVNSTPAVSFNSANDNFLTVAPSEQMNLNGDLTMYCYANPASTASQEVFGENNGNIANAFELQLDATTLSPRLLFGDGNVSDTFDGAGPALSGAPHVWSITSQIVGTNNVGAPTPLTNSVSWWVDGAPFGNLGTGHNLATAAYPGAEYTGRPIYIGGRMDHGAWMNGTIGELMLFGAPLSGPDRTNVDNYLGQKYFSFSIANNLPASITSSNGFTVTYTIGASQGSLHFAYQWQENGTNIPGATGSTYTTPTLGPSENNATYDVVLTSPSGTIYTSSTSTLTVLPDPPYVTSAGIPLWEATSPSNIVVLYDIPVDPATATAVTNYSLNSGSVLSAAIGAEPTKVILTTTPLVAWNANPGNYLLTISNVLDFFGDTNVIAPVSTPVGLYPAGTALWLEANVGVDIDSANTAYSGADQWNDQSGNGADLFQNEYTALEPILTTNYHGNAAIQFSGTNVVAIPAGSTNWYPTFMWSAGNQGADYPCLEITNDMSIFAVAEFNTLAGSSNGDIVSKTAYIPNANKPAPYDFYVNNDVTFYRGNGTNITAVVSTNSPSLGFPHIVGAIENGYTVNHFLDAAPSGTGLLTLPESSFLDEGQALTIGMRIDKGNRLNGDLFELILISSAVDSNDLASIQSYLASKYTIPTGINAYPAITKQPVARTNAYATTTLTVPVGVSLGNPAATIQWYDTNGVAIAGQNSATLLIPNIQASDTYYLVASNMYGSAISSQVAVNVPQVNLNPTNIVFSVTNNNQLVLNWPADHIGWQLQAQTNRVSVGLSNNWVNVSGTTGTNQVIIPVNPGNGTVFYRLMLVP